MTGPFWATGPFWVVVVGVSFAPGYPGGLDALEGVAGPAVYLAHDPANPVDPNAVAVVAASGERLGYLPKDMAARFGSGEDGRGAFGVSAQRLRRNAGAPGRPGLEIRVAWVEWAPDAEEGPGGGGGAKAAAALVGEGRWAVASASWPGRWREVLVDDDDAWCSCPSGFWRPGRACRHLRAVMAIVGPSRTGTGRALS